MAATRTRDDRGVTLVGLVAMVVVLALVATVVLVTVGRTTRATHRELSLPAHAAVVACRSTVASVKAALQTYRAESATGTYPATIADLAVAATAAQGPVLRTAPHTVRSALSKDGWAFVTYDRARGTFEVATVHGPTRPTATPTVCEGA